MSADARQLEYDLRFFSDLHACVRQVEDEMLINGQARLVNGFLVNSQTGAKICKYRS